MIRRILAARCRRCSVAGSALCRRRHAAQRVLRSDARALCRLQQGVRRRVSEGNRQDVEIKQSHGGSGKQARAVIDGLEADVVTLALAYDIDAIAEQGTARRPTGRSGCRTTPRPTPRPSCSWCARAIPRASRTGTTWSSRASGHHAEPEDLGRRALELPRRLGLCAEEVRRRPTRRSEFVAELYKNVPVLDTGARGSTITFVERGVGDVLLAWENEAFLALKEFGKDKFEIVVPSLSILAEPPVAVVDKVVDKKGTRAVAEAYLSISTPGRPGDRRKQLLPSARCRGREEIRRILRQGRAVHDRRRLRRLAQGAEGRTSPTAASSTRSTRTESERRSAAGRRRDRGAADGAAALPGFGLTSG